MLDIIGDSAGAPGRELVINRKPANAFGLFRLRC
jgi:hypothetical protein